MSNLDDPPKTAKERASRKWANADLERRYKEAKAKDSDEFSVIYGKKERPTAPPGAQVITPNDAEIETIEKQRARQQRKLIKLLTEIVHYGRSTITIRGPELKGRQREMTLAGYGASLAQRKRKLLLEKLRRLTEAQAD